VHHDNEPLHNESNRTGASGHSEQATPRQAHDDLASAWPIWTCWLDTVATAQQSSHEARCWLGTVGPAWWPIKGNSRNLGIKAHSGISQNAVAKLLGTKPGSPWAGNPSATGFYPCSKGLENRSQNLQA
jgi:hypothetical protein